MNMPATGNRALCHGCRQCLYTAPFGQQWNPQPHLRCAALRVDVPMIVGSHGVWLDSVVPDDCPEKKRVDARARLA